MKRKNLKAERTTKSKVKRATLHARMPSGDLVSFQISATIRRPKHVKLTKELLAEMVRRKAESSTGDWDGKQVVGASEGKDPSGITLRIKRWKNPERSKGKRAWRDAERGKQGQADAWGSLRRALTAARINF